ncbi:MAG: replication initiator protein A [Alphaproteobacteria bacterium]|nr:replication initiator protein A [Lachnospiraceae bacterium]MBQ2883249.1 replication initiator protein A [Alphaproteobacteria bacterium]MBQ6996655.1 replication initiator protein A [Lachnospiraceae bacterium]MBQ6996684.1 replication initiator protein A [Lachnospiraceae bacterium]
MGDTLKFDYYYGIEAEQFSFYRVPRLLIKDTRFRGLSSDAKLLYGLMLDRMSLSMKNGWLDDENRAYIIYTVDSIMEDLGCSKPTCTKIMRELDSDNGIGLIEKKRRGLGKPDIIYVKNFASIPEENTEKEPSNADVSTEVKDFNFKKQKNLTSGSKETELQEVKEFDFKKQRNLTSGGKEVELQEVNDFAPNYTNYNQTNMSNNNMSKTNLIYQSEDVSAGEENTDVTPVKKSDANDMMDDVNAYMKLIRENIEYDYHMKYDGVGEKELFEEIYDIICDVVCVPRRTIRIGKEDYPYELVKSRFLKLNSSHVDYVRWRMKETNTKITNIRAYMITTLYNAPATINHFYQQEVQHDMYGGGWNEEDSD